MAICTGSGTILARVCRPGPEGLRARNNLVGLITHAVAVSARELPFAFTWSWRETTVSIKKRS